jgi:hypothetical protein
MKERENDAHGGKVNLSEPSHLLLIFLFSLPLTSLAAIIVAMVVESEVAVKSFVSSLSYCFTRFGLVVTSLATSICFCMG